MSVYLASGRRFYTYGFILDGVRYQGSTKRSIKKEALAVEQGVRKKLLDHSQLGILDEITLRDAMDLWYKQHGSRLKGSGRIQSVIKRIFGEAGRRGFKGKPYGLKGSMLLSNLTTKDILILVNKRFEEGMAPASITQETATLRTAVNRFKKIYQTNPSLEFPTAKTDKRLKSAHKIRFLSLEEEQRLLVALDPQADRKGLPPADQRSLVMRQELTDAYDLAVLLLDTGCRFGEAITLLREDVDTKS